MKKNIFKKIITTLPIALILIGFLLPVSFNFAEVITPCVPPAVQVTLPDGNTACQDNTYHFLAPLPCDTGPGCEGGKLKNFDPTNAEGENSKIGEYLNIMIRIFIGICAVLAVIMIVMGGIEYMTSELISNKENGKHHITGAIFGLLLALGAWTILNQINPDILNTDLSSLQPVEVEVTLDDANFANTEQSVSATGTSYKLNGSQTAGINNFISSGGCSSLSKITVNTSTKKADFCAGTNCVSVPINTGFKGVAEPGQGQAGDSKTPKGTYAITGDRRIASGGKAVTDTKGLYNLGAAFINIGVGSRGIGFHGDAKGGTGSSLGTTNGCVRMSNDDLAALAPCMKSGTTVVIQ